MEGSLDGRTRAFPVFSLQILIGGDFRMIDGEKIRPRVRRPPELVGSVKSPGKGAGVSTPADF